MHKKIHNHVVSFEAEINDLANRNLILRRQLEQYKQSIKSQKSNISNVEVLYKEAGLVFGSAIKKTLAEARAFHQTISKNRKRFLGVEIKQIKNEIANNDENIAIKSGQREKLLVGQQS